MRWNAVLLMLVLTACGSEKDAAAENSAAPARACSTASDCGTGFVCLSDGREAACMPICTGDADACGAEASCGGVGVMSVEVCQPPQPAASPENPPEPEEQPRIPCKSDSECSTLQVGAICAEWRGARDCTIPCSVESDCDMPSLGGVSMDFMTCAVDEGQPSRSACLPDPACFADVMSCIDLGGFPGGGGGGGFGF